MQFFKKDNINTIMVIAANGAATITGKVIGDFTVYMSKDGAVGIAITPTTVIELDSTNMSGVYAFKLPAVYFDTAGVTTISVTCTGMDQFNIIGDVGFYDHMLDVRSLVGHANFTIGGTTYDGNRNLIVATMKGYDSAVDAAAGTNARIQIDVTSTYDANGNMTDFLAKEH